MEDPTPFLYDDDSGFQAVIPSQGAVHRIWGGERAACPGPASRALKPGTTCRCRTKTCRAVLDRRQTPSHTTEPTMPQRLSDHFTLAEMTFSATAARKGIANIAPPPIVEQLILTADRMEKVRDLLGGHPIRVLSGYRSEAVNRAVGGSRTSAHRTGHAVDFVCPGFGTPAQVAAHLAKHLTGYDQIIEEFGQWVHVGFGPGQRLQKLTARKVGGRTRYTPGIAG